jgi:tetratricopeptide (TPR) repeat protein
MTIRSFQFRLACWLAPVVGLLLLAGFNDMPRTVQSNYSADVDDDSAGCGLKACPDPQLESLQGAIANGTIPVAYPASELDRPMRIARPFPLAEPQLPLPRSALLPPATRDPNSASATPAVTGPELSLPPDARIRAPNTYSPPGVPVAAPAISPPQPLPAIGPSGEAAKGHVGERLPLPVTSSSTHRAGPASVPDVVQPVRGRVVAASQRTDAPRPHRQADAMRAVNQQAEQMIRRGYYLAERGALYSARAEFIQALRAIVQALDIQSGTRDHSQALAAGLTALEEAEDFVPDGSRLESDLDIAALVKAHQTPICKDSDAEQLMPIVVLQHYYTFAQAQLALSAGGEEAASMALFGLGKTYATLAIDKSMASAVAEPKAMVFHWAALSAHAGNFLAANELAVLEARWGQYAAARSLLQHSVAILPHSAVWRNLAVVHQRLGEAKLAELAMREAEVAAQREASARPGNPQGIVPAADVEWLDSKAFAATSRTEIDVQKPAETGDSKASVKATPVVMPAPSRQRSAAGWWFPWLR